MQFRLSPTPVQSKILSAGLAVGGLSLSVWLLSHVEWANMVESIRGTSSASMAGAALATIFSFCGLAAYDVIAVRHLHLSGISNARALTAGAVGYGVTNFVGFPWITGALVRNVFYGDTAIGIGALMTVVISSWIAFWTSITAITGTVLLLRPEITNRVGLRSHGPAFGILLLLGVAMLMLWLSRGRHVRIGRQTLTFMERRVTLAQCAASLVDLAGSAAVLYVFMPAREASDPVSFFGLFVVAVALGVLSHVPAGLGAFEGTMLLGLQGVGRADVTVALVMYRAFRTVMPFLLSTLVLGAAMVAGRGQQARRA